MGLYDTIYVTLRCPVTKEESELEIQIKWTNPYYSGAEPTCMREFRVGEQLPYGPQGNLWMPEESTCKKCGEYKLISRSEKQLVKHGRHDVYIHLDNGKILEIILEQEFDFRTKEGKIKEFVSRYGTYQTEGVE